jgi:hypothetical protein
MFMLVHRRSQIFWLWGVYNKHFVVGEGLISVEGWLYNSLTAFEDSNMRVFFFFRLHLKKDGQVALWVHTTHFCCLVHHLLFAFGQRQVASFMCFIFPNIIFKNPSLQDLFYSDLFPMDASSCFGIYADLCLILGMSTLQNFWGWHLIVR